MFGTATLVSGFAFAIGYLLFKLMWQQEAKVEKTLSLPAEPGKGKEATSGDESHLPSADEQSWLLDALAKLIAERGSETFLEAPLLEPTPACFPDPFTRDLDAVRALTRRLLHYADLADLRLQVQAYGMPQTAEGQSALPFGCRYTGAVAWFAGIEAGECLFGVHVGSLKDEELLVGTMCHEIAHAWRCHHGITGTDRDLEECLTDLTTVYLGFGILTTNTAYRYRQTTVEWSHATGGYLGPKAMSYLLAAQVMARGTRPEERRSVRRLLEPNQADFFAAACEQLEADTTLTRRLGLRASGPRPAKTIQRPAPPPIAPRPSKRPAPAPVHFNSGLPTFRVRRTQAHAYGLLGFIGGIIIGSPYGFYRGTGAALLVAVVISVAGWITGLWRGHRIRWDYCSDPDCSAELAPDLVMCPGCGGSIRGEIASQHDRYDAAERMTDGPRCD
jgi:hypothetical protein